MQSKVKPYLSKYGVNYVAFWIMLEGNVNTVKGKPNNLEQKEIEMIEGALKEYGASINEDGFIKRGEKVLPVRLLISKGRLRAEGKDGNLIASFPVNKSSVSTFVEKFWFWEKQ